MPTNKFPRITKFRKCAIAGCEVMAMARKMCMDHYRRWKRYGDPLKIVPPGRQPKPYPQKS